MFIFYLQDKLPKVTKDMELFYEETVKKSINQAHLQAQHSTSLQQLSLCILTLSQLLESPLWCSCLENPMDGGAWWAAVYGVAGGPTRLSDFTFTFHFHALEKEMATHSSVLAWRIPGMGEPGGCRLWGHTGSDTTEVT